MFERFAGSYFKLNELVEVEVGGNIRSGVIIEVEQCQATDVVYYYIQDNDGEEYRVTEDCII